MMCCLINFGVLATNVRGSFDPLQTRSVTFSGGKSDVAPSLTHIGPDPSCRILTPLAHQLPALSVARPTLRRPGRLNPASAALNWTVRRARSFFLVTTAHGQGPFSPPLIRLLRSKPSHFMTTLPRKTLRALRTLFPRLSRRTLLLPHILRASLNFVFPLYFFLFLASSLTTS